MTDVSKVKESIHCQQILLINHIWGVIWDSDNTDGILQWRDRNKLHKLDVKLKKESYLLSHENFQFLESLLMKLNE